MTVRRRRALVGADIVTPPDLSIRPFGAGDLPALQRVREAAFGPVFRSFREIVGEEIASIAFARADAEQAALLDDVCRADFGRHMLVATADDAIVGFVSFTTDPGKRVGEIGPIAVHPDHANRGIGTGMVERAMARMRELGMAVAEVSTGGDVSHAPARRAYEKAGFGAAIPSTTLYRLL